MDIDEGDQDNPNIRCRYVAKEIAYQKDDDDGPVLTGFEYIEGRTYWRVAASSAMAFSRNDSR